MQQLSVIRDLIELKVGCKASSETAWLFIEQARLLRITAGTSQHAREQAVQSCQDAIDMLRSMCTAELPSEHKNEPAPMSTVPKTLLDDLASAYTWHGICSREINANYNGSFALAVKLWNLLLQATLAESETDAGKSDDRSHNASFFSFPDRTISLLEALATLFGLLDQFTNQVLLFRLIELINSRVKDIPNAGVDAVTALSCAGHSMARMGHLSAAEEHFARAQQAELNNEVNFEYLLYHSFYLIEKGDAELSETQIKLALKQTMETDHDMAQQRATATAVSAELVLLNGDPALATSMATQAFTFRYKPDSGFDVSAKQWAVISELLDSLFQMGRLYKLQGVADLAIFYYKKGVQFAEMSKLPNVKIKFLLALADIHCKKHDWDKCSLFLNETEAILSAEVPTVRITALKRVVYCSDKQCLHVCL